MAIPIVILCCVVSFLFGIGFLFLLLYILMLRDNKKKKIHNEESKSSKNKLGTMNIILIIVGISLLVFTIAMIVIFVRYNSVPDTLITYVFITLGGECGVLGWIKTTKEKSHINRDDKEAKG